jgi:hypothetical protein
VVDLVGELLYWIFDLILVSWPAEKDRWVIPIAIGASVLIVAFVALALFMQSSHANLSRKMIPIASSHEIARAFHLSK